MNTVTFFTTLMKYAREEAAARKSGDSVRIAKATAEHEAYKKLCLQAERMIIPSPNHPNR